MAINGDLSSFPLPELLQWLDGARKTGSLQLTWEAGERKLYLLGGQVSGVAAAGLYERTAGALARSGLADGAATSAALESTLRGEPLEDALKRHGVEPALPGALAREALIGGTADLIAADSGRFFWTEDADRAGDEWLPLSLSVRELLFESLRWLDEQPEVDRALPKETMQVVANVEPAPSQPLIQRALLALCAEPQPLGRLQLDLGLSRATVTRRVVELLRLGWVEVDGAAPLAPDPVGELLEKGAVLVRERQHEAAALVFGALLASDPSDRRVREFARMVEAEHVAELYRELSPVNVPHLTPDPDTLGLLKQEERQLASMVNGVWDVSTLVLASPVRELETLKCLAKLRRMGVLTL